MLKDLLKLANETLDKLIEQTKQDIQNIKSANHLAVSDSVAKKNSLIKQFESTKKEIDKQLIELAGKEGAEQIGQKIDEQSKQYLSDMRQKLQNLHDINKEYAKHVVMVKEFFDSLINEIFVKENDGIYKARV